MAGRLERGPSPPRRKPLGNLGEKREVPLGAVEPVAQRVLAVELAARDVEVIVARLAAAHPELDAGARVARRFAIEDERHAHDERLDGAREGRWDEPEVERR